MADDIKLELRAAFGTQKTGMKDGLSRTLAERMERSTGGSKPNPHETGPSE